MTEHEKLLQEAQSRLSIISRKIDEQLPRVRRKRAKRVKTDGPVLADDLGLEAPEQGA